MMAAQDETYAREIEIEAFFERLEQEAGEERSEVVHNIENALIMHGDRAETEDVSLSLRQKLLQQGLSEEQ